MALAASIQLVYPRMIALYKFLWHLRPTLDPNVFASLFQHFVVLLKSLRSKWQTWYKKQMRSKPPSSNPGSIDGVESEKQTSEHLKEVDATNVDRMVIPLNNISCSLYPFGPGLHDASRSSQMLNASRSSHNLGIITRSRNTSCSSHNVRPSNVQQSPISPIGGGYTFTIEPTSPLRTYSQSSPALGRSHAADLHDALLQLRPLAPQIFPERRSNSPVESIELLSPGEISSCNSRAHTPSVVRPLIAQSNEVAVVRTASQSPISFYDQEIPPFDHHIYPNMPESFQRYEKRRRIPKKATKVEMKPMVMDFSDYIDPPGWTLCTHPEGACYFYNEEKRIFTDVDLHDSAFFKRIVKNICEIENFIDENHISIPEGTDLVLDINKNADDRYVTDYYFANHQLRIIFFLDHFSTDHIPKWGEIKGVSSGKHLQHEIEAQYWWHCLTYPNSLQLSNDLVCELRDTVMYYIGDSMTSPYANSPYTLDNLYKILSLTDGLKENVGKPYGGCTSLLSRLMFVFSRMKFHNFHGQPEARLNRDQSVHGTRTNNQTWFIKTISLFLFSAPDVNLKTLQKMWVDNLMHKAVWEASLQKLNDEWQECTLYATVMLNANVAFLGIQTNDVSGSAAQISSYCSVSTSIGSIILGLLLVRQNQTKSRDTADDAQRFLKERAHPLLGLETLAILHSLPYALLMWSMVSFLVAFLFACFKGSGVIPRSLIGSLCGVIAVLVAWCIWASWEKHPPSDAETPENLLSFEKNNDSRKPPRSKKFTFVVESEITEEPQPSALGFNLPMSFTWPAFLRRRRQSYDSNGTIVGDAES